MNPAVANLRAPPTAALRPVAHTLPTPMVGQALPPGLQMQVDQGRGLPPGLGGPARGGGLGGEGNDEVESQGPEGAPPFGRFMSVPSLTNARMQYGRQQLGGFSGPGEQGGQPNDMVQALRQRFAAMRRPGGTLGAGTPGGLGGGPAPEEQQGY